METNSRTFFSLPPPFVTTGNPRYSTKLKRLLSPPPPHPPPGCHPLWWCSEMKWMSPYTTKTLKAAPVSFSFLKSGNDPVWWSLVIVSSVLPGSKASCYIITGRRTELTEPIHQMWSLTHSSVCAVRLQPAATQNTARRAGNVHMHTDMKR